jgi:hypothetical protein
MVAATMVDAEHGRNPYENSLKFARSIFLDLFGGYPTMWISLILIWFN